MRVLFVLNTFPPFYTGGAEVSAYHTARGLQRAGVDVSILVLNHRQADAVDEWLTLDGLPVHRVHAPARPRSPLYDLFDARLYRALAAELRRLAPDVVHVHNVSGTTLAPFAATRRLGVPTVCTVHDYWLVCANNSLYRADGAMCEHADRASACRGCFRGYDFWADVPRRRAVFRRAVAHVRRFISPSRRLIDIHAALGYARDRFSLVPYGLDDEVRAPAGEAVRRVIATAAAFQNVMYAGGGIRTKGIEVLLRALPLLKRRLPRLRLIVVGGGEPHFLDALRAHAPSVVVMDRVPFGDMRALFGSADLTVVPSTWHDNSPVVIYENLQVGTPVAGADAGGIPELIRDGETGYVFPVGDAAGLAEKVLTHFARPAAERRAMRARCARDAREHRTLPQHVAAVQGVYAQALADG